MVWVDPRFIDYEEDEDDTQSFQKIPQKKPLDTEKDKKKPVRTQRPEKQ